jgi:hypothetical protein
MSKKAALLAFIIGALMLAQPLPAFAGQALADITCADSDGNETTIKTGWNNENPYFEGKGEIPRLFCELGFAGIYTTYISDTLEPDSPLRWYNGIAPTPTPEPTVEPTPEPTPEPSASTEPTLEPSTEPTQSPEPEVTPTLEPTTSPTPEVSPTAATEPTPTPEPEPTQTPTPEPTPTIDEPTAAASIPPIEPEVTPTPEPSPLAGSPTPSVNPQLQTIELPEALQIVGVMQLAAAAEAIMNVGADMTDEEREEAQIVAIAAIIVSQIAGSIRGKTK